jgi:phosphate:Na+ symporter
MHNIDNDDDFNEKLEKVKRYEDITDNMEYEIAHYLQKVSEGRLSDDAKHQVQRMLRELDDLESIGDCAFNISRILSRKRTKCKAHFTEIQLKNIQEIEQMVGNAIELMISTLNEPEGEGHDIDKSYKVEDDINKLRSYLREENIQQLSQGAYDYQLGAFYIDTINGYEKLADYVLNVVESKARKTRA